MYLYIGAFVVFVCVWMCFLVGVMHIKVSHLSSMGIHLGMRVSQWVGSRLSNIRLTRRWPAFTNTRRPLSPAIVEPLPGPPRMSKVAWRQQQRWTKQLTVQSKLPTLMLPPSQLVQYADPTLVSLLSHTSREGCHKRTLVVKQLEREYEAQGYLQSTYLIGMLDQEPLPLVHLGTLAFLSLHGNHALLRETLTLAFTHLKTEAQQLLQTHAATYTHPRMHRLEQIQAEMEDRQDLSDDEKNRN